MTKSIQTDVVIVGGGASGVTAAIQTARMGARVLLVEETPWLGGMLTSAGVSALDGNDAILSGLHREFVHALWDVYGGREAVRTGWVSNTLYEPKVGQSIIRKMIDAESNIELMLKTQVLEVLAEGDLITGVKTERGEVISASVVIDATECGDVIAMAGVAHRFGRESRSQTGEVMAPQEPDDVIQDLTWVLTLREYPAGEHRLVEKPSGYDPSLYDGSVLEATSDPARYPFQVHDWKSMIDYGRLPNGRIMLNWPHRGNDHFSPGYITQSPRERRATMAAMKEHALGFLHYLQTECGHPEVGLDDDAYPTADGQPLIPYVRESRRIEAMTMLHLDDVVDRGANPSRPLHMAGIAVGDYFIDHHHNSRVGILDHDQLCTDRSFPAIQAITVPLGCLVPVETNGLIAAEKSIGVTHVVNGVTRLQPVVMNIGQAAGALAALSAQRGVQPREVNVREVQQALLDAHCLLMPFADVGCDHPHFQAIHRVAVCGLIDAFDEPRRCGFRPEEPVKPEEVESALLALEVTPVPEEFRGGMSRAEFADLVDRRFNPFRQFSPKHTP